MFQRGYWTLGNVRGTPVRVHWSFPLAAILFAGLSPIVWLAFAAIILLHEAGHALLVRRYGFRVLSVDLTGFGGQCRWSGVASARQRSVIAWGGVAAQSVLLVATLLLVALFGWPTSWLFATLAYAFIKTNALIIGLNLLPIRPLDGAEAWPLVTRALRQHRLGWRS